jgi:hypothetical protein
MSSERFVVSLPVLSLYSVHFRLTGATLHLEDAGVKPKELPLKVFQRGKAQLHEPSRIQIGALPADGDMKMGAGCSSRASAQTDGLAALHTVAFFHFEFGKMQIESEQSLAVIEHYEIALEI